MARLVHILDYAAPGFGRPDAVSRLCTDLSGKGYQVTLLIGQAAPAPRLSGVEVRVFEELPPSAPGYALNTQTPLRNNPSTQFIAWAEEQIVDLGSDLIHAHDLAGLQASAPFGAKLVSIRSDIRRNISDWLPLLSKCSAIECFNPEVAAALGEHGVGAVSWNMSGVPAPPADTVRFQGEPRLLWQGRMDENRSPENIISCLPELLNQRPGLRLSMVGDGPLRKGLQQLSADLKVNNIIDWHGWVERPNALLAGADLALFTGARMGFDRAPAEAMRFGRPLVVSRALSPVVKGGDLGEISNGSPDDWFAAIGRALEETARSRDRIDRAADYAEEHYSHEACLGRTLKLYDECLSASA